MEVPEVRVTIGRLFRSVAEFLEQHTDIELESLIPGSTMETFQVLSDEYEFNLRTALKDAEEFEKANPPDHHDPDALPARLDCEGCGNPTLIQNEESSTGYRCLFCGNEDGDNIPANYDICGISSTPRRGVLMFNLSLLQQLKTSPAFSPNPEEASSPSVTRTQECCAPAPVRSSVERLHRIGYRTSALSTENDCFWPGVRIEPCYRIAASGQSRNAHAAIRHRSRLFSSRRPVKAAAK